MRIFFPLICVAMILAACGPVSSFGEGCTIPGGEVNRSKFSDYAVYPVSSGSPVPVRFVNVEDAGGLDAVYYYSLRGAEFFSAITDTAINAPHLLSARWGKLCEPDPIVITREATVYFRDPADTKMFWETIQSAPH